MVHLMIHTLCVLTAAVSDVIIMSLALLCLDVLLSREWLSCKRAFLPLCVDEVSLDDDGVDD